MHTNRPSAEGDLVGRWVEAVGGQTCRKRSHEGGGSSTGVTVSLPRASSRLHIIKNPSGIGPSLALGPFNLGNFEI